MNNKSWNKIKLLFASLIISFSVFSGCQNLSEEPAVFEAPANYNPKTNTVKIEVRITSEAENAARAIVVPDFSGILSSIKQYKVVYYPSASETPEADKTTKILNTGGGVEGGKYSSTEISLSVGTAYKVEVYGYTSTDASASPVVTSTENFTPTITSKILTIKPGFTQYQTSSQYSFKVKFPASNIYSASEKWYVILNTGGAGASQLIKKIDSQVMTFSGTESVGTHTITFTIFKANDESSDTAILASSKKGVIVNESIVIYDYIETSKWQGDKVDSDGVLDLSNEDLTYADFTDYFVYVGEQISAIATANSLSSVVEQSKSYKRLLYFTNLQDAINTIQAFNDGSSEYLLWVNGTFTGDATNVAAAGLTSDSSISTYGKIALTKDLKLTIAGTHSVSAGSAKQDIIDANCSAGGSVTHANILTVYDSAAATNSQIILKNIEFKNGWLGPDGLNSASSGCGGAINSTKPITAYNCDFKNNIGYGCGGAVYIEAAGASKFTCCLFSGNILSAKNNEYGTAVYTKTGNVTFDNCKLSENEIKVTGSNGGYGALSIGDSSTVILDNTIIIDNVVKHGAVYISTNGTLQLKNVNLIRTNQVFEGASGEYSNVYIDSDNSIKILSSLTADGINSEIGITVGSPTNNKVLTFEYGSYNAGTPAETYFSYDNSGYSISTAGAGSSAEVSIAHPVAYSDWGSLCTYFENLESDTEQVVYITGNMIADPDPSTYTNVLELKCPVHMIAVDGGCTITRNSDYIIFQPTKSFKLTGTADSPIVLDGDSHSSYGSFIDGCVGGTPKKYVPVYLDYVTIKNCTYDYTGPALSIGGTGNVIKNCTFVNNVTTESGSSKAQDIYLYTEDTELTLSGNLSIPAIYVDGVSVAGTNLKSIVLESIASTSTVGLEYSDISFDFDSKPILKLSSNDSSGNFDKYIESFTNINGKAIYSSNKNAYLFTASAIAASLYSDPSVVGTVPASGDVVGVSSEDDLKYLDTLVKNNNAMEGVTFKLAKDVELSDGWTGIGALGAPYKGEFDGNGKTISRINSVALFSTGNGLTIKNLTIEGEVTSSSGYVSGLIGYVAGDVVIENCVNKTNVSGSTVGLGIGGFVATCSGNLIIRNCINEGNVSGNGSWTGGFIGSVSSTAVVKILNSGNKGSISAGTADAGGLIGGAVVQMGVVNDITVKNCFNTGTVTGGTSSGTLCGSNGAQTVQGFYYLDIRDGTSVNTPSGTTITDTSVKASDSFGYIQPFDNAYNFQGTVLGATDVISALNSGITHADILAGSTAVYKQWKISGGEIVFLEN